MRIGAFLGIVCAIALHAGVILFGGALFLGAVKDHGTLQQVELLSEDDTVKKDQPQEPPPQELETQQEEAPDAAEILRNLEQNTIADAPALDAASLGAIEAALNGLGGGEFGDSTSLASGGRIGGTGKAGATDDKLENAFSLAEIDQKPQATFQAAPVYPAEMRGKRIEGLVTVIFVVDSSGKVVNPRSEKSSHVAFEKPALDAVKKWKFEPGVKAGQRVACKMRVPIRFQPS